MPSLFTDKSDFNEWFDMTTTNEENDADKMQVITCIHKILRPFMLRRTKSDLAEKLPDKIEMNVSLGLSPLQNKLYREILTLKGIFTNSDEKSKATVKQFNFVVM